MNNLVKMMRYLSLGAIGLMLLASCMSLNKGSKRTYDRFLEEKNYDAIIVPGVPFENGEWSEIMKMRVHWAKYLYDNGIAKNIVFSGSSVYSPYIESRIMALYAEQLGIPKEHIYTEERAEHSSENLYYSYRIAKNNGMEKVALATDPFQGSFLRGFANKIKLYDLGFLPIQFDILTNLEMNTPEIDPQWAKVEDFVSITKRENALIRFQGTMGKYIEYEAGDDPKEKRKQHE